MATVNLTEAVPKINCGYNILESIMFGDPVSFHINYSTVIK